MIQKLSNKRQTFQIRIRREHINEMTKIRRQKLNITEEQTNSENSHILESTASELLRDIYGSFERKDLTIVSNLMHSILEQSSDVRRKLINIGILDLLASFYEQVEFDLKFRTKVLKTFASLIAVEGISESPIHDPQILVILSSFNKQTPENQLQVLEICAKCCCFDNLKETMTIIFKKIARENNTNLSQEFAEKKLYFYNNYFEFVRTQNDQQEECLIVRKFCLSILKSIKQQQQQPKSVEYAIKILQILFDDDLQTTRYPFPQLIYLLQLPETPPQTKHSILSLLLKSFTLSQSLALHLTQSQISTIPTLITLLHQFPSIIYKILTILAPLPHLSSTFSEICQFVSVNYLLEVNFREEMFELMRSYVDSQEQFPMGVLRMMAGSLERVKQQGEQEEQFWWGLVDRGYRGDVPGYVITSQGHYGQLIRKAFLID